MGPFKNPIGLGLLLVGAAASFSTYAVMSEWFEPEFINRVGALMSALGAGLVLYQTFIESRFEKQNVLEKAELATLSPVNAEIAQKVLDKREHSRKVERVKIISAIAVLVFAGEIMHGWGDSIYRLVKTHLFF